MSFQKETAVENDNVGAVIVSGLIALCGLGIAYGVIQVFISAVETGQVVRQPGILMAMFAIGVLALVLGVGLMLKSKELSQPSDKK